MIYSISLLLIHFILLAQSVMWHHVKGLEAFRNHNSAIVRKQYQGDG